MTTVSTPSKATDSISVRPDQPKHLRDAPVASGTKLGRLPLSVLVIAVPLVVYAVFLAASLSKTFTSGGDVGFIEISVRQVLHGGTALGAYSRYGWHHPGPAFLYLFAPIYWLSNSSSRALFLDSWLLNAGCALAVVALIRHYVGEGSARIAAMVMVGFLVAIGHFALINPWNPSLLAMPVLLMLTAGAIAAAGSAIALVVAYVAGSFAVQTHIGTVPIVGVTLLAASVAYLAQYSVTNDSRRVRRTALVAGIIAMGVMWAPPIYQQATGANGNLALIAHFYRDPPVGAGQVGHSFSSSAAVVSDYATLIPFGSPLDNNGHRNRLIVVIGFGALGLAVAIAGWRRQRTLAWFGLAGSGGLVVAVVAATRVIGPFYGYLFEWTEILAVLPIIGALGLIATKLAQWRDRRGGRLVARPSRTAAAIITVGTLALVTGLFTNYVSAADLQSFRDSPEARQAAQQMEAYVGNDKHHTFNIKIVGSGFDDGDLAVLLDKAGYSFRLDPEMDLYNGTSPAAATAGPTFYVGVPTQKSSDLPGRFFLANDDLIVNVS